MIDKKPFEVQVAPDTMIRRDSGSIVGHIWIDIHNWSFPSVSWDDFPVVILGWWIDALLSISSRQRKTAECNFMDGPYWFEISMPSGQVTSVRFFKRSKTGSDLMREESINFSAVIDAMFSAARTTIDACNKRNWTSIDLENLVAVYSTLRSRYPRLTSD